MQFPIRRSSGYEDRRLSKLFRSNCIIRDGEEIRLKTEELAVSEVRCF